METITRPSKQENMVYVYDHNRYILKPIENLKDYYTYAEIYGFLTETTVLKFEAYKGCGRYAQGKNLVGLFDSFEQAEDAIEKFKMGCW